MATIDKLGTKRTCPHCTARFYDLNKRPATCPKCAASFDPTVQPRARRRTRVAVEDAADSEDLLLQHMAKATPGKSKPKAKSTDEDVDLAGFEDIETGSEGDLEEIEEIDDIEVLEEIEDIEPSENEEEEGLELEDGALIDNISDEEELEAEEEETPKSTRKKPGKR